MRPGKFNRLPLHNAAKLNDVAAAKQLLSITAVQNVINAKTDHGFTALYIASQHGNNDIVLALVQAGADLHLADKGGLAPLHIAARNGHCHVVRLLLDHNADCMQLDTIKWTPLHWAYKNEHDEVKRVLEECSTSQVKEAAFALFNRNRSGFK
jgi:ankyrin repeat protein